MPSVSYLDGIIKLTCAFAIPEGVCGFKGVPLKKKAKDKQSKENLQAPGYLDGDPQIRTALMQVASLTGDFCGHSTWLKNKQNFPQLE